MSVQEIKQAITELPTGEVERLVVWLDEYRADAWDRQIERDALAGRLSALGAQADREFEASRPLLEIASPRDTPPRVSGCTTGRWRERKA